MNTYPDDLKASLIKRMLPPQNASVSALARETGRRIRVLLARPGTAPAQIATGPGGG